MLSSISSACPLGVEGVPIKVEVDVREGALKVSIVGLPDTATRESKDRLIPAITNSGWALRSGEIVINLSPAGLRKEGTAYDLPMALGILAAKGILPTVTLDQTLFVGELALDGQLRPVRAVLAAAECARQLACRRMVVPRGNGPEAALIDGLEVYEAASLGEMVAFLRGSEKLAPCRARDLNVRETNGRGDFAEVKGHVMVKRVLEIAAAGHHNVLMFGPPGAGKSMLAKRLPTIMEPLSAEEILEVTRIYSCAGKLGEGNGAITVRPFRAPHHTASPAALIGGGPNPRPGEVTLAHRGVLFLDEFPEYPRTVLEVLRQPLEDREVTVSRALQQVTFPADFLMAAAMNPCPCGWRGNPRRPCECTLARVRQYRSRISGPLLDRIDLHVEVAAVPLSAVRRLPPAEASETIAARVANARQIQRRRFGSKLTTNANMSQRDQTRCCALDGELARLLDQRAEALGFSARVHGKVLRVARTIADLAGRERIEADDLMEAFAYRQYDQPLPDPLRQATEEVRA